MTPEAQKYLRTLFKEDSRKFFEINEDSRWEITSAVLNEIALTPDEIDYIRYFIKNGSPTLVIEFRPDHLPLPSNPSAIFINGKKIPDGVKLNLTGFIYDGQLRTSPDGTSENRLKFRLRKAEVEENYKECQEIMKYAEYKGWNLKKK